MALPDSIRILDSIVTASDKAEIEIWDMRQKHIFEMAWLCDKQADRRAKYQDLSLPIESIQVPPDLFAKVEIKRVNESRVNVWIDNHEFINIGGIDIKLLPNTPPKLSFIQAKTNKNGCIYTEVIDGEKQIANRTFEVLASSLIINM